MTLIPTQGQPLMNPLKKTGSTGKVRIAEADSTAQLSECAVFSMHPPTRKYSESGCGVRGQHTMEDKPWTIVMSPISHFNGT